MGTENEGGRGRNRGGPFAMSCARTVSSFTKAIIKAGDLMDFQDCL